MSGYDQEWERNVRADHRKNIQQCMGECLADAKNLVLTSNWCDPKNLVKADKTIKELAPIIGEVTHAMFLQRSSHVHFYMQKRKREDADRLLKEKFPDSVKVG